MKTFFKLFLVTTLISCVPQVPEGFQPPTVLPVSTPTPENHVVFDSDRTGNFEIFAGSPDNPAPTQLTDDPNYDSWWPRVSPNRETILFYRTPKGTHDRDYTKTSLWAVAADGTGLAELRPAGLDGWDMQGHVEWNPAGNQLVMFAGNKTNPQIWVTTPTGTSPQQLTSRGGRNLDPSYSTDGTAIWFTSCPQPQCYDTDQEIYKLDLPAESEPEQITHNNLRDNDPCQSPDSTQLGWLTQYNTETWDIQIAEITATGTDQPHRLVGDETVTSRPQWVDNTTIITHRLEPGAVAFDLVRIDVVSGQVTRLAVSSLANDEYPSP